MAAALSLLLHGWMLSSLSQSFDFKISQRSGTTPLSTRMILTSSEPEAAAPDAPVQSLSQPSLQPASPAPTNPPPVAQPQSSAPIETPATAAHGTQSNESAKPDSLEQNRPIAGNNSTQNASESIAKPVSIGNTGSGLGSAAAQPSAAMRVVYPRAADLEYEVVRVQRGQTSSGPGMLRWKSDGSEYELVMEWGDPSAPMLRQHSVGKFDAMGLAPERFSDKRANRSEQATHFRRLEGVALFSNNKPQALLLPGMQDPLSALIQLAGILGGDPKRFEIVNIIRLPVASLDDTQLWEMSLDKPMDINVAAANMRAIKLQRKPRNEFDPRFEIWLAPQLGYLPIRIRQSEEQNPEANYTEFSLKRLPF